jgi:hypothetical protein
VVSGHHLTQQTQQAGLRAITTTMIPFLFFFFVGVILKIVSRFHLLIRSKLYVVVAYHVLPGVYVIKNASSELDNNWKRENKIKHVCAAQT